MIEDYFFPPKTFMWTFTLEVSGMPEGVPINMTAKQIGQKNWRQMLEQVGGYENECVYVPARAVREIIDELEALRALVGVNGGTVTIETKGDGSKDLDFGVIFDLPDGKYQVLLHRYD